MSDAVRSVLLSLLEGGTPSRPQTEAAFDAILAGACEPSLIAGFLTALRMRGETVDDIVAGATVLRRNARSVAAPPGAVDTCGTGGLPWTSLNTSTAAAILAASAGAVVAKHGNRSSAPPKTGSADVLEALGVNIACTDAQLAACFDKARVAFMFAPAHHSAMRHVAPVRKALGFRTAFNLLGPLANPAGATRQLLGVFAAHWMAPYAQALRELGSEAAWIVHGSDGLDELTVTGPSRVAELRDGDIRSFEIAPEDVGLQRWPAEAIRGGDPAFNAAAIVRAFEAEPSAFADLVALNAGAALVVAGFADKLAGGVALARAALADGRAHATLQQLKAASHG